MKNLLKSPDPYAVLVGVIIEVMVILDVIAYLNLTAEQVAQLGGLLLIAAGSVRTIFTRRKAT